MPHKINHPAQEAFWMVWSPEGNAPTFTHFTPGEAVREAERLAQLHPEQHFYVLQSIELRVVNNMQRVKLAELPF